MSSSIAAPDAQRFALTILTDVALRDFLVDEGAPESELPALGAEYEVFSSASTEAQAREEYGEHVIRSVRPIVTVPTPDEAPVTRAETSEPDQPRRLVLSNGMRFAAFSDSDDDVQVTVFSPPAIATLFIARKDIPAVIAFLSGLEEGQS